MEQSVNELPGKELPPVPQRRSPHQSQEYTIRDQQAAVDRDETQEREVSGRAAAEQEPPGRPPTGDSASQQRVDVAAQRLEALAAYREKEAGQFAAMNNPKSSHSEVDRIIKEKTALGDGQRLIYNAERGLEQLKEGEREQVSAKLSPEAENVLNSDRKRLDSTRGAGYRQTSDRQESMQGRRAESSSTQKFDSPLARGKEGAGREAIHGASEKGQWTETDNSSFKHPGEARSNMGPRPKKQMHKQMRLGVDAAEAFSDALDVSERPEDVSRDGLKMAKSGLYAAHQVRDNKGQNGGRQNGTREGFPGAQHDVTQLTGDQLARVKTQAVERVVRYDKAVQIEEKTHALQDERYEATKDLNGARKSGASKDAIAEKERALSEIHGKIEKSQGKLAVHGTSRQIAKEQHRHAEKFEKVYGKGSFDYTVTHGEVNKRFRDMKAVPSKMMNEHGTMAQLKREGHKLSKNMVRQVNTQKVKALAAESARRTSIQAAITSRGVEATKTLDRDQQQRGGLGL